MTNDEIYLWLGGWLENDRCWWHPPECVASFPIEDAVPMAKRDEDRGLRLSYRDLDRYHRKVGLGGVPRSLYDELNEHLKPQ